MALVCPDNSSGCRSSYCSQSRAPIRSWSRYEWPIPACDTLQPMTAKVTLATRTEIIKTSALCADECFLPGQESPIHYVFPMLH